MTLHRDTKVGAIAATHPLATRVFARHGIDFCCGGGRALESVCSDKGLDPDRLLQEIRHELEKNADPQPGWNTAPLDELIAHILDDYHTPLVEELPRLEGMARKVLAVHGEKDPQRLEELVRVFETLRRDLELHMLQEEREYFPAVLKGSAAPSHALLDSLAREHETVGRALEQLNHLCDGYTVPAAACNTWRALWHGLAALEQSLHQHIHLENNILFPRAVAKAH